MRRRKRSTKYSRRERDTQRMLWIKTLPCAVVAVDRTALWGGPTPDPCSGAIEAHHAGRHGMGQKAPDDTCIPLCRHHHAKITGEPGGRGVFDGWPSGMVKLWELAVIQIYQHAYDSRANDAPF